MTSSPKPLDDSSDQSCHRRQSHAVTLTRPAWPSWRRPTTSGCDFVDFSPPPASTAAGGSPTRPTPTGAAHRPLADASDKGVGLRHAEQDLAAHLEGRAEVQQ